ATVEGLAGHSLRLLEAVAIQPEQRVVGVSLLSAEERQRLLVVFNASQAEYPEGLCLHELIEAQAERSPDAVAVVCEGLQLSYAELNARANRLAHHLGGLGVGPEVL